jgi:hypothetical protein
MPPEHLFKYTTADAATAILDKQSLRWSSPLSFNDPFGLKNYFHVDFLWSEQDGARVATSGATPLWWWPRFDLTRQEPEPLLRRHLKKALVLNGGFRFNIPSPSQ